MYQLQLEAPVPFPVICDEVPPDLPDFLGRDYHGCINHVTAANLLKSLPEGAYLVRKSKCSEGGFYTLSLKYDICFILTYICFLFSSQCSYYTPFFHSLTEYIYNHFFLENY